MKKFLIASTALFLMAILYSSCRTSHGTCPAYGKVNSNKELPA